MKKNFIVFVLIVYCSSMFSMDSDACMTLETVVDQAPSMDSDLKESVESWLEHNKSFVTGLTGRAHSYESHIAKKEQVTNLLCANSENIVRLGDEDTVNHSLKPNESDDFIVQIARWGRLLAHLVYITNQGDVTKETINSVGLDWEEINSVPNTYMGLGRLATFLLLQRAKDHGKISQLNLAPTFIAHIPGRPETVNDENFVVVQKYIPGFTALKRLPLQAQREVIDSFDDAVLQDMYNGTKASGAWDICGNIGVVPGSQSLSLCDYEPTIFNHPEDFFFQNNRGYQRYLADTCDSLIRTGAFLKKGTKRAEEKWQQIIQNDSELLGEIRKNIEKPSIVLEYEGNASCDHKNGVKKMYEELPEGLIKVLCKK